MNKWYKSTCGIFCVHTPCRITVAWVGILPAALPTCPPAVFWWPRPFLCPIRTHTSRTGWNFAFGELDPCSDAVVFAFQRHSGEGGRNWLRSSVRPRPLYSLLTVSNGCWRKICFLPVQKKSSRNFFSWRVFFFIFLWTHSLLPPVYIPQPVCTCQVDRFHVKSHTKTKCVLKTPTGEPNPKCVYHYGLPKFERMSGVNSMVHTIFFLCVPNIIMCCMCLWDRSMSSTSAGLEASSTLPVRWQQHTFGYAFCVYISVIPFGCAKLSMFFF